MSRPKFNTAAASERVAITVRIGPQLIEALRNVAIRNRRGFSQQVEVVLEAGLKALKEPVPDRIDAPIA